MKEEYPKTFIFNLIFGLVVQVTLCILLLNQDIQLIQWLPLHALSVAISSYQLLKQSEKRDSLNLGLFLFVFCFILPIIGSLLIFHPYLQTSKKQKKHSSLPYKIYGDESYLNSDLNSLTHTFSSTFTSHGSYAPHPLSGSISNSVPSSTPNAFTKIEQNIFLHDTPKESNSKENNIVAMPSATSSTPSNRLTVKNIKQSLQLKNSLIERINAVLATRGIPDKKAIPLLKLAIADPEDDVRLVANSLLENREKKWLDQIQQLELELKEIHDTSNTKKMAILAHSLARLYWSMHEKGFYEGILSKHCLHASERYGHQAQSLGLNSKDLSNLLRELDA